MVWIRTGGLEKMTDDVEQRLTRFHLQHAAGW